MIAIIDYGVGNLFSLKSSLDFLGLQSILTRDPDTIKSSDKIILPGVGAFPDAVKKLKDLSLDLVIKEEAKKGKPILGICLGMQLLCQKSYEYGEHEGLCLVDGEILSIKDHLKEPLKVPHIGWNALDIQKDCEILKYVKSGQFVYYVHSFFGNICSDHLVATSEYGINVAGVVQNGNVYGAQFHPEKSGEVGLNILKAFGEL